MVNNDYVIGFEVLVFFSPKISAHNEFHIHIVHFQMSILKIQLKLKKIETLLQFITFCALDDHKI
jgi:hypothetical protein